MILGLHHAHVALGGLTLLSALVFRELRPDDGAGVRHHPIHEAHQLLDARPTVRQTSGGPAAPSNHLRGGHALAVVVTSRRFGGTTKQVGVPPSGRCGPLYFRERATRPCVALDLPASLLDMRTRMRRTPPREASPDDIQKYFNGLHRKVLTFLGYSGAGYESPEAMLEIATRVLDEASPADTLVNIGATADGIGAVYEVAQRKGFHTTGIVSVQARDCQVPLSPYVDRVFFVKDDCWGGFIAGTEQLSPTSAAIVASSDLLVAIGGGDVARDELVAAVRLGRNVRFIPADMHHEMARAKARKKGQPEPTDFRGTAMHAMARLHRLG